MSKVTNITYKLANSTKTILVLALANMIICGAIYAALENKGVFEGQWWSVVTAFTVGYGDQYPTTSIGRVLGAWVILSFFVLLMFLNANITAQVIKDRDEFTHEEQEELKKSVKRLNEKLDFLEKMLKDERDAEKIEREKLLIALDTYTSNTKHSKVDFE